MSEFRLVALTTVFSLAAITEGYSQLTNRRQLGGADLNTITTAVPFLMISPDARSGGMGDVGVALSPDANAIHWNAAKLAFAEDNMGLAMNYTPWLRNLVPDISLSYLSFYKKIDDLQTFGASLRYFSLGDITFTSITGEQIANFRPNELALDGVYARKLSDNFSIGIGLRYIYSNLAAGLDQNNQTIPGQSAAGDISAYYQNETEVLGKKGQIAFGASITNLGAKIAYTESGNSNFLPTNLRLGTAITAEIDDYNKITFALDLNKLLVPSNPIYARDSITGQIQFDGNGNPVVAQGQDPNQKTVLEGVFSSFGDAPNGGLEELREINIGAGMEYWYNNVFALRTGYFYEHPTKGGRQYLTFGAGLKYQVFNLNFSYLVPTTRLQGGNPLENTLRFSMMFDLAAFSSR
ncbi:MAG: type IX secretion system outer membrane channel protein PorV [Sphingobacteriaceae bacterium]|nr:type IX secretion system outer membrane channel protein PorV [Sphingobacteriaceae bacterium]